MGGKTHTQKLHNANIFLYKLPVSQILTRGLSMEPLEKEV